MEICINAMWFKSNLMYNNQRTVFKPQQPLNFENESCFAIFHPKFFSITLPLFIEVPALSQKSEHSFICV
jgi:hypothetical protein